MLANTQSIKELEEVLSREIDLYEEYLSLLKGDLDLMARLNIEELETSNKAKTTILLKVQAIEEARQKLVSQISQEKSISEEKVKITDICKTLPEDSSKRLMSLRDRLAFVMKSIRDMQDQATAFAETSLCWIDGSMETLKRLLAPTSIYNARGKVDEPDSFAGRKLESKA